MLTGPAVSSSRRESVSSVKSVSFKYRASVELGVLLEDFRLMCNDAIGIAIRKKPKGRFELIELACPYLKQYHLHSHYILSACEVACSAYKNKKRKSMPYVKRAFLKLDKQSYRLIHLLLRIPVTAGRYIFLTLQGSNYHSSFIDDPRLKRGSVTITNQSVSIAFSKQTPLIEPVGNLGMDINERNVTVSTTDGFEKKFEALGEVAEIKERYREIRARIGKAARQDRRIERRLFAKYGKREKNRTSQRIHEITHTIVDYASTKQLAIKMEKLRGIRRLYHKGNGRGASFRGRMNSWVFGKTRRLVDYKAAWLGVPAYSVDPRGTSSYCPDCGSRVALLPERKLYCAKCDRNWDRDVLASKNIMACAVPQDRPSRGSSEGERGDDGSNPPSRWREVGLLGQREP
ncbi:MAG TPA: transposase [Nitrososphaerales archaeon]|nr:transposase [Nitrososphaerales archaeon]